MMSLHPGAAVEAMWVLTLSLALHCNPLGHGQGVSRTQSQSLTPGALLETTRGSTAVYREHVPHPSSSQRTQDAVLRVDTKPRELEQAVYGNLPRAKSFNLLLFFFLFLAV